MFDKSLLAKALTQYKQEFISIRWDDEKFKWEAVRWFQDHWNVNAEDFHAMLHTSLDKAANLLDSRNNLPRGMIEEFAEYEPETVRSMFINLFDESKNLFERMNDFKARSALLLEKYKKSGLSHYQDESTTSTYLWLRYPDKYYVYKFRITKKAAEILKTNYHFKQGAHGENIHNFMLFYNEVNQAIKEDTELTELFRSQLTPECYPDPELKTLTMDICFYISKVFSAGWIGENYDPGITTDAWEKLLADNSVFTPTALEVLQCFKACGGISSCIRLASKFGKTWNFYNSNSSSLAKRICEVMHVQPMVDSDGKPKWWTVLYLGRKADDDEEGNFVWKLRDELFRALVSSRTPYTKSDFLRDVYMSGERYERLVSLLRNKKNIILQGAPGVGKTFAARRLAWAMMGEKDNDRVEFVQFHQNYSYEDFMMGYKPVENGFEMKHGIFYRFCEKAAKEPGKDFFFIIDEINRGNMSKIFGELLMLIEKDYRGTEATLAYNGESFAVPENLYIIGMMNTADRSLAMIDYALRRRFSFVEIDPGFDSEGFLRLQEEMNNDTLNDLIERVKELNQEIAADKSLGKGFCIGHSYFCLHDGEVCTEEWLRSIVDYDLLPTLSEYWFDDPARLQRWENVLQGVFQ